MPVIEDQKVKLKFIRLHSSIDGCELIINAGMIIFIKRYDDYSALKYGAGDFDVLKVKESLQEIEGLING